MENAIHPTGDFRCSSLAHEWARLEQQKARLLPSLGGLSEQELSWKRSAGEWSVLQVLDHVILTEEAILAESRKVLAREMKSPAPWQRLRIALFNQAFQLPIRVKVPQAVSFLQPSASGCFDDLQSRWEILRAEWKQFVRVQDCTAAKSTAMSHPVMGPLCLAQAVAFMRVHTVHHCHQLKRIRAGFRAQSGAAKGIA